MRLAAVLWVTASWIPALLGVGPALGATASPPVIRILEPSAGTLVAAYPVLIRGTVTPPDPDLRVTVNTWPTLMLPDGQWATLEELAPGTHELVVEGRARGAVVSRTVQRVTVLGPAPTRWPLPLRGGAQWAGLGMDRAVPVGTAPFDWTFRLTWWEGVTEGELDPEGDGRLSRHLRGGEGYTHRFPTPGLYAPRLRYTDPGGRVVTQQGLVLVFDRAWLEPILRAQWQAFVTALAQNDLATAAGLVEITRRENFEPWRALLSPQQWQRVAAFFSARPLGWVGLHGYLATFQLGSESEEIGIEFTPDQGDGRWRYYLRDALLLGAVLATEH